MSIPSILLRKSQVFRFLVLLKVKEPVLRSVDWCENYLGQPAKRVKRIIGPASVPKCTVRALYSNEKIVKDFYCPSFFH